MSDIVSNRSNCNTSYLSGINFQLMIYDLPEVSFNCQSAGVPSISITTAVQPTRWNAIPHPGDELNFDDLSIRFLVDENLKNYMTVHKWLRFLSHPESVKDFSLIKGDDYDQKTYSDAVLFIQDSNFQRKIKVVFYDLYPVSLGPLAFDATYTDTNYISVDAVFKYTYYKLFTIDDEEL